MTKYLIKCNKPQLAKFSLNKMPKGVIMILIDKLILSRYSIFRVKMIFLLIISLLLMNKCRKKNLFSSNQIKIKEIMI
jgi:hypothetical protein